MKSRYLVCSVVVLATLAVWLMRSMPRAWRSGGPAESLVQASRPSQPAAIDRRPVAAKPRLRPGWSRAEAAKYLQVFFAREQLRAELDLERLRYRGQYWETEPGLAELQGVAAQRGEIISRLAKEMNGLLADACPGEPGEPLVLTAFFNLDQPGPNLAFLSEASREKMEDALLALAHDGSPEPGRVLEVAGRTLTGQELADYTHWNAPASAALRNRLAGYSADEEEFAAILRWQSAGGSDQEDAARLELEKQLGPGRLAQWNAQCEPAVGTALQDLRRLGRPLEQATWLADFRVLASSQFQKSWTNPALTDAQRQAQVGLMRNAFRDELAAQLDLPAADADLLP